MQVVRKMTSHEAEWYGAECAIQDAIKNRTAWATKWAKPEDFENQRAWNCFRDAYRQTYRETREDMRNAQAEESD